MLQYLKIISFKWVKQKEIFFDNTMNCIIWENGVWKTNILESIGILFWNQILSQDIADMVHNWDDFFYLESHFEYQNIPHTLSLSYDKNLKKKTFLLNGKKTPQKNLILYSPLISAFIPLMMNLFYLGPKYRRDFLDGILKNISPEYWEVSIKYEKIVKHRNKILKNISEQLSSVEEIYFWDQELIKYAEIIYRYRKECIAFFNEFLWEYIEVFWLKVSNIIFEYKTKTNLENIWESMKEYLTKNLQRDIILAKTNIWPHLDDFDIVLDGIWIDSYASRWETKSIIIILKLLELKYIEKMTGKKAIFLVDDLVSELDEKHKHLILENLRNNQVILTNIWDIPEIQGRKIFI